MQKYSQNHHHQTNTKKKRRNPTKKNQTATKRNRGTPKTKQQKTTKKEGCAPPQKIYASFCEMEPIVLKNPTPSFCRLYVGVGVNPRLNKFCEFGV